MRTATYLTLVWLLGVPACEQQRSEVDPAPEQHPGQVRVGVYDSRAVAVAYCDSDRHRAQEQRLKEALEKARQSGDAEQIHQADRALWESRKRMHRQAFSTCPVDDILDQYAEELERIKQEEQLTALISRWDTAGLDGHKGAERIDVTARLVPVLAADEKRRRSALEVTKIKPIPPDRYEKLLKKEAGEHY